MLWRQEQRTDGNQVLSHRVGKQVWVCTPRPGSTTAYPEPACDELSCLILPSWDELGARGTEGYLDELSHVGRF